MKEAVHVQFAKLMFKMQYSIFLKVYHIKMAHKQGTVFCGLFAKQHFFGYGPKLVDFLMHTFVNQNVFCHWLQLLYILSQVHQETPIICWPLVRKGEAIL